MATKAPLNHRSQVKLPVHLGRFLNDLLQAIDNGKIDWKVNIMGQDTVINYEMVIRYCHGYSRSFIVQELKQPMPHLGLVTRICQALGIRWEVFRRLLQDPSAMRKVYHRNPLVIEIYERHLCD